MFWKKLASYLDALDAINSQQYGFRPIGCSRIVTHPLFIDKIKHLGIFRTVHLNCGFFDFKLYPYGIHQGSFLGLVSNIRQWLFPISFLGNSIVIDDETTMIPLDKYLETFLYRTNVVKLASSWFANNNPQLNHERKIKTICFL